MTRTATSKKSWRVNKKKVKLLKWWCIQRNLQSGQFHIFPHFMTMMEIMAVRRNIFFVIIEVKIEFPQYNSMNWNNFFMNEWSGAKFQWFALEAYYRTSFEWITNMFYEIKRNARNWEKPLSNDRSSWDVEIPFTIRIYSLIFLMPKNKTPTIAFEIYFSFPFCSLFSNSLSFL